MQDLYQYIYYPERVYEDEMTQNGPDIKLTGEPAEFICYIKSLLLECEMRDVRIGALWQGGSTSNCGILARLIAFSKQCLSGDGENALIVDADDSQETVAEIDSMEIHVRQVSE